MGGISVSTGYDAPRRAQRGPACFNLHLFFVWISAWAPNQWFFKKFFSVHLFLRLPARLLAVQRKSREQHGEDPDARSRHHLAGPPLPCLRCDDKKIPRGANGRLRRPSSGTTDTSGWRGQSTDSWKRDSCTFPCSGRDDAGGRNHRSFPGPTFGRRGRRASPGGPLLRGQAA